MTKRLLRLAGLLFVLAVSAQLALAQSQIPIIGHFGGVGPDPSNPTIYQVQLQLAYCGGNIPRVFGVQSTIATTASYTADSTGLVSGMIWPNDVITCGQTLGGTRYNVSYLVNNSKVGPTVCYQVLSTVGTFNLDAAIPCAVTPPPPPPPPPYVDAEFRNLTLSGDLFGNNGSFSGLLKAYSLNGVVNASSYASLNLAVAACLSVACTVDVNASIPLTANLVVPSYVVLRFNAPGFVNLSGFTLATASVQAGPYQIFSGPVTLGTSASQPPLEWFGAIGDWNGTTGTDNTAAIQSCLNSLSSGQCVLQSRYYRITAALTITHSNIGMRGPAVGIVLPSFVPSTISAALISTSTTADMISLSGTGTSTSIGYNKFNDMALRRSVIPANTAAGFRFNYVYASTVDRVSVEDSGGGLYFHGVGASGIGSFENISVSWGFGSVHETTGSYAGFFLDSADGVSNPSIRIRNSAVSSAVGSGVTTYGLISSGTALNDLHLTNFETAGVSYGEYIVAATSPLSALDIHLWDTVNDNCQISCMLITTGSAPAAVEINGGWSYRGGTGTDPVIDLEGAHNVTIANHQIYYPTAGPGVKVNGGANNSIGPNVLFTGAPHSAAVSATTTSFLNVTNDQMVNITATCAICFVGVTNGNVSLNNISGTGTFGISLDAGTHGIGGLPANSVNGAFSGGPLQDLGGNPTTALQFQIGNGATWDGTAGAPSGACVNGSWKSNSLTTAGTFPNYQCRNLVWVGVGTVY